MGLLDVKIQVSTFPSWKIRNERLQRLKSVIVRSNSHEIQLSTSTSSSQFGNGEIQPSDSSPPVVQQTCNDVDMPDVLYQAAATDDVDGFLSVLEQVSLKMDVEFLNILQLLTPSGNTLLHVAVINGCEGNVKLLLYHSPVLVLKQNINGDTPLHLAMRIGYFKVIFAFMDFLRYKGKSEFHREWINMVGTIPDIESSIRLSNSKGNTVVHEAAFKGCCGAINIFIQLDVEACFCLNNHGKSPLYVLAEAADGNSFGQTLNVLSQVDFKEQRLKGLSPILPAVLNTNKALIDEILKYEPTFIKLLDEDGKTPLHYAASIGSSDKVKYILSKKVEYALMRDQNGFLPIHTAAAHGNINVIRQLLQYGLGPSELLTPEGQNIVHVAALRGQNNVVCFALQTPSLEGLINEADVNGNTPLHLATLNWHAKVVFTMTWDKRVDLGCANKEGFTPLDAVQYYMERPPSFDKRLTWTALKAAGAPQSPVKESRPIINPTNPIESQLSNTVDMNNYRDRVNSLLVVATLVATVTFASGFTVPGGYNNSDPNQGTATMLRKKAFQIFILSDTVAVYSSILVTISLIWAQLGDINLVFTALQIAIPLLGVSLAAMSLAFMSGVYLVVSQLHWLAYTVLITGITFLGGILLLFVPLSFPVTSRCRIFRYCSYYPSLLLIRVTSKKGHGVSY
ncbi:hypothetical protein RND81_14G024300 [Saponaria officinalis]|uniref:PGG domain-containing protein n=1 Tax=Saponaria officinalis TaxID=3572 RepID=A0AAW1GHE4_SAPOF